MTTPIPHGAIVRGEHRVYRVDWRGNACTLVDADNAAPTHEITYTATGQIVIRPIPPATERADK